MSATTTVTVTGQPIAATGLSIGGGSPTGWQAVSDNNDATYLENTGAGDAQAYFSVALPSIPAGTITESIKITLRQSINGFRNPFYVREVSGIDTNTAGPFAHSKIGGWSITNPSDFLGTISNTETQQVDRMADGALIEQMNAGSLVVLVGLDSNGAAATCRLYEVDVTFTYNSPPAPTFSAPAASPTTTTTSRPTVTWALNDPDGDAQLAYRLIVVGVTDPTFAWDSGKVYSTLTSLWLPVGLTNGHSYDLHLYSWGPSTVGLENLSAMVTRRIVVAVTPPLVPPASFTLDNTVAAVHLIADEGSRATPHPTMFDMEKSLDSGATWEPLRDATRAGLSVGVWHTGAASAGIQTPSSAITAGSISDGFTLRWHGALSDYTPAALHSLFSNTAASPNIGWDWYLSTSGFLVLRWSTAGTSFDATATATAAVGVTDGTEIHFEAKLDATSNPWRVDFRKSTDGINWTAIGAQVVGGVAAHPLISSGQINIGANNNLFFNPITGYTYSAELLDENDVVVTSPNFVGQPVTTGTSTPFTDAQGVTWTTVGAAYAQARLDVWDRETKLGVPVTYRMRAWRNDTELSVSAWTTSSPITISNASWWLKDPLAPTLNRAIKLVAIDRARSRPQTVSDGLDSPTAIVTHSGLRGNDGSITVRTSSKAEYDALVALAESGRTVLLQSVLMEQWYCQLGGVQFDFVKAAPEAGEGTPVKHLHEITVPFVEVAAP